MTDVDLSRLPKGFLRWHSLVTWLAQTDDTAERYFLEKKSHIRLDGKEGKAGRAKVAKFILGAANRDPDKAARRFEGHALLVLGVGDNGKAPGVPSFEALDLEHDVQRFIGVGGPQWDFERIRWSESCDVIVIVVDPPDGQVWPCRADGPENLIDGEIYIRADGGTRAAKGNEKHAMFSRLAQRATPSVKVSVSLAGAFYLVTCDVAVLEEYVTAQRDLLMAPLRRASHRPHPGFASLSKVLESQSQLAMALRDPESRTEDEYRAEIDAWAVELRATWPNALAKTAAALPGVSAVVSNLSHAFLEDVEVEIRFNELRAVDADEEPDGLPAQLPSPPSAWGPKPIDFSADLIRATIPPLSGLAPTDTNGCLLIKHAEPTVLRLPLRSLRPEAEFTSDSDVVLLTEEPALAHVTATWRLTARGHNTVYSGDCELVRGGVIDLTDYARHALRQADQD